MLESNWGESNYLKCSQQELNLLQDKFPHLNPSVLQDLWAELSKSVFWSTSQTYSTGGMMP